MKVYLSRPNLLYPVPRRAHGLDDATKSSTIPRLHTTARGARTTTSMTSLPYWLLRLNQKTICWMKVNNESNQTTSSLTQMCFVLFAMKRTRRLRKNKGSVCDVKITRLKRKISEKKLSLNFDKQLKDEPVIIIIQLTLTQTMLDINIK